jgi:hypothetical protein
MSYTNAMREDAQRGCQGGAGRSPAGANCYAPNDPRIAYQGRGMRATRQAPKPNGGRWV